MKQYISIVLVVMILAITLLTGCDNSSDSPAIYQESDFPPTTTLPVGREEDFSFQENEDGTLAITWYYGYESNLTIPNTINGKEVTVIRGGAFSQKDFLVSVVIPDSVTVIESQSFSENKVLESVVLSKNLLEIQGGAFQNCISLSDITLPEGLVYIGTSAFEGCTSLKSIRIPDSVTELSFQAFPLSGLEKIEFGKGLTELESSLFVGTNIKEIVIPSNIRKIDTYAFSDCRELERITLSEGLESIAQNAFYGCSKLTEIVIPATVTEVYPDSFFNCDILDKIKFEGDAPANFEIQTPDWLLNNNEKDSVSDIIIYYHEDAAGFTSPEWNGFKTALW